MVKSQQFYHDIYKTTLVTGLLIILERTKECLKSVKSHKYFAYKIEYYCWSPSRGSFLCHETLLKHCVTNKWRTKHEDAILLLHCVTVTKPQIRLEASKFFNDKTFEKLSSKIYILTYSKQICFHCIRLRTTNSYFCTCEAFKEKNSHQKNKKWQMISIFTDFFPPNL